ncbi:tRNA uridine-5-carboxymethylaminomethyl(34) synthesis GTPase MnmE [Marinicella rhabdoformis]|uniref:tRNA uridine-5-carboxymethylaminomethyl(34) synthesis GTPase MnmE n=1 Tax=Marinicella rhabdoformis TaxID=2580566 RepID=UPI0012AECA79|nr:tRNA uridine-5-carboxymethylaminomethyl(34) synthesis GTPase MnmE [Marinicella rhabdoformis]
MTVITDTIAAIATPAGTGGVGIIRISGKDSLSICQKLSGIKNPQPRKAYFAHFKNQQHQTIDSGLVLYFKDPASFTGEDVVELQGHGGHVVMHMLLKAVLSLGARMARPGEFSERAFLNDKIDLVQAEAIADVISSGSEQAVLASQRALKGEFSTRINNILELLIQTRIWVESAIDFPEEEIDFLADTQLREQMNQLNKTLTDTVRQTQTGVVLNQGISIAIVGKPNAGKSSLLNCLTQENTAIISDVAGTTRDVVKEDIVLQGIPVRLLDTAGIHETDNPIEQQGIEKALTIKEQADVVLHVVDGSQNLDFEIQSEKEIVVINKSDLIDNQQQKEDWVYVSALTQNGIEALIQTIVDKVTVATLNESTFTARKRHIKQLEITQTHVAEAEQQLTHNQGELSAEELRLAQNALSEITGEFSSDDLLGRIFSSFCIGK